LLPSQVIALSMMRRMPVPDAKLGENREICVFRPSFLLAGTFRKSA